MEFHIIANAALGKGLSGSDRIFIELSKNLQKRGHQVVVYVWEEGYKMCISQNLRGVKFVIWKVAAIQRLGFVIIYIFRILNSIFQSLALSLKNDSKVIIYSASDFWMDSLPGWILKIRFPKVIWIGTYYLAAPNPLRGFKEHGELSVPTFKDSLYYVMQKIPYFLIRSYADLVCITSEPDIDRFPNHKRSLRYLVVKGGVDIKNIEKRSSDKKYDALFQGRFHKQKGVLELIDIWMKVLDKLPGAKLAMIGDGPLMASVKLKIKNLGLENNIKLFGYLFDGPKKSRIFNQSRIVVHPAIYDSGGMAPAEAMAFGLPGVSFDLKALRSYYPKGLLKANIGDLADFADKIIELLENKDIYKKMSVQAIGMIKSQWSWENRTNQFLDKVIDILRKRYE